MIIYTHSIISKIDDNFFCRFSDENHDNHSLGEQFYQKVWSSNTSIIGQGIPFGDFVVGLQVVQRDDNSA